MESLELNQTKYNNQTLILDEDPHRPFSFVDKEELSVCIYKETLIEQDREDEQKLNIISEIPEITLPESLVNIIDFLFDLLAKGLKLIKHVFVVVKEKLR